MLCLRPIALAGALSAAVSFVGPRTAFAAPSADAPAANDSSLDDDLDTESHSEAETDSAAEARSSAARQNVNRSGLAPAGAPDFDGPIRWWWFFLSFVDFAQTLERGFHYSELRTGHAIGSNFALGFRGQFLGPTRETDDWKADFGDPEFGADVKTKLPTTSDGAPVWLIAGSYLILPGSRNSWSAELSAGWRMYAGFEASFLGWQLRQTNTFAFMKYRQAQPSSLAAIAIGDEPLAEEKSGDSGANSLRDPRVVATEIRLQAGRPAKLIANLWWQNDLWYVRADATNAPPDQLIRVGSTLGYAWSPGLTTFAGLGCETRFGQPGDPPPLAPEFWVFRFGIFIPL